MRDFRSKEKVGSRERVGKQECALKYRYKTKGKLLQGPAWLTDNKAVVGSHSKELQKKSTYSRKRSIPHCSD